MSSKIDHMIIQRALKAVLTVFFEMSSQGETGSRDPVFVIMAGFPSLSL
jgi:hypothetical protein